MKKSRRWKLGNNAGGAFLPNGDLWTARHVTAPDGRAMILVVTAGFRDTDRGREKVILDRKIVHPTVWIKGHGRSRN